jgi:guanylate kinase
MNWNILLIWPSWSGKTTVSKEIISIFNKYSLFVADASRSIRDGEQNWIDYNFIPFNLIIEKHWNNMKNYLIESYFGKYYWYDLTNFNKEKKFILTPWVCVAEEVLKRKQEFWFIISILLTIDKKGFVERLKSRWETEKEIKNREWTLELLDFTTKVDLVLNWATSLNEIKNEIKNKLGEFF